MPPPADIVKVAIEWPDAFPKLMEIDQVLAKHLHFRHIGYSKGTESGSIPDDVILSIRRLDMESALQQHMAVFVIR
ncbi:unnamed protein product [Arctogadus glacialis]